MTTYAIVAQNDRQMIMVLGNDKGKLFKSRYKAEQRACALKLRNPHLKFAPIVLLESKHFMKRKPVSK